MRSARDDLRLGVRSAADLGRLPRTGDAAAARVFQVRAPRGYLDRVDWSDPADPIAAQVLPDARELVVHPGERGDPIGDAAWRPVPRLTHRYPDRVLLFPTYECAVYCRHCFRKEAVNGEPAVGDLGPALDYISANAQLREVILTGGDPWMLPDARLAELVARLAAIPHLRRLRVHTRIPVVLPGRVTPRLITAHTSRLVTTVVLHTNHPREVSADAASACAQLRRAGFLLLNQSVLLRGVNDDAGVLRALSEALVDELGARPYYLHHCDLTRGLAHLRTSLDTGLALVHTLDQGGLLRPTYVLDLPGGDGKVVVEGFVRRDGPRWTFRLGDGREVDYVDPEWVPVPEGRA